MDAALRLFLDQGVAPTTIEQITVGAQVAKGTFYLHFSSKDDVLVALRERFVRGLLESIDTAVRKRPAHDWRGRLEAWARASIDAFLDSARLHDIVFHEFKQAHVHGASDRAASEGIPGGDGPHSKEEHADNALVVHLGALLEAGTAAGAWRVEDPRFTAVFLFNGYHGIVDDARVLEKRVNRARLARRMVEVFFRAVGLAAEHSA